MLKELSQNKKLAISISIDLIDFIIGRVPIIGTFFDIMVLLMATRLYSGAGWLYLWEVIDVTELADSWIPTLTLINIYERIKK